MKLLVSLVNGGNVKRKNIVNQKRPNRGCIIRACFPTCQVRVSTVLFRVPSLLLPSSFPPPSLLPSSFPQRQTPDLRYLSGHCLTSTANSRSQWAPDLNDEVQISVGATGPQRRAADLSGHCWTSTARAKSQWAAGRASPSGECPCPERMSE